MIASDASVLSLQAADMWEAEGSFRLIMMLELMDETQAQEIDVLRKELRLKDR